MKLKSQLSVQGVQNSLTNEKNLDIMSAYNYLKPNILLLGCFIRSKKFQYYLYLSFIVSL